MIPDRVEGLIGAVAMRGCVLLVACMVGAVSTAQAADLPDLPILRGAVGDDGLSSSQVNWDGYYVGGQGGYETSDMDFSGSAALADSFVFRNTELQDQTSGCRSSTSSMCRVRASVCFVGHNWQWEDTVFGLEANYNYMNRMVGSSSSSLGPVALPRSDSTDVDKRYNDTSVSATAAAKIKDVVTLRGRAGWAAGSFMPYVFGGIAMGRMEVSRTTTTDVVLRDDHTTTTVVGGATLTSVSTSYQPLPSVSTTYGEQRTNSFVGGWTGGLGFEVHDVGWLVCARRVGIHQLPVGQGYIHLAQLFPCWPRLQVLSLAAVDTAALVCCSVIYYAGQQA